jgi:hypothetical protein
MKKAFDGAKNGAIIQEGQSIEGKIVRMKHIPREYAGLDDVVELTVRLGKNGSSEDLCFLTLERQIPWVPSKIGGDVSAIKTGSKIVARIARGPEIPFDFKKPFDKNNVQTVAYVKDFQIAGNDKRIGNPSASGDAKHISMPTKGFDVWKWRSQNIEGDRKEIPYNFTTLEAVTLTPNKT